VKKMREKITYRFLLLVVLIIQSAANAQYSWIDRTPLPNGQGREMDLSFTYKNLGFMGLGLDRDLWCYDSQSNSWMQKRSFPGSYRQGAYCFALDSEAFFGGGNSLKDFWKYNARTDSWTQLPSAPFASSYAIAFAVNGKGYVLAGNLLLQYDRNSATWSQKSNFPSTGRAWSTALVINGKAYVAFGQDQMDVLAEVWEYNPATDVWTKKNNGPGARKLAYGFAANNKGYFGGGRTMEYGSDYLDFYEYDPVADTWTTKSSPGGTSGAVGFCTADGNCYYGFGNITCHIGPCSPYNFLKAYVASENTWVNSGKSKDVLIFPNPGSSKVTLKFQSAGVGYFDIKVFDQLGACVYTGKSIPLQDGSSAEMNTQQWPAGLYIFEIMLGVEKRTVRYIKQ
jgi:N-acetylneuraminic acid mutarotase